MTGQELDRKAIFERLTAAGWHISDRGKATGEAYMEYLTLSKLLLEVQEGVSPEKDRFFFFYLTSESAESIQMNIHFHDDPAIRDSVLNYIVEHQDDFSEITFKNHLRKMLELGPEILLDTEDDLVPLVDDEKLSFS